MKKLWFPALVVSLCGFSCAPSSGGVAQISAEVDFGARNAAWDRDPCEDYNPEDCGTHAMQCECSGDDGWSLVDRQTNSPSFEQDLSPSTIGKVSLWGYYWANCGTCEQQFAFMQTMKDELKTEGYEVEFVGVMYTGGDVGRFGNTPRDAMGACNGSRAAYPSCTANPGQITLDMPVVVNGGPVATQNGVEHRGSWFIYRADGRLFEFINSEALPDRGGFLGDAPNWNLLKSKMKAAAMVTSNGVQPCSSDYPCTHDGQWCQYPEGSCGGQGQCVTSELAQSANTSMGVVDQVCPAEGRMRVCACSGVTYASHCDAELDQENISYIGACD